MTHDIWTTTDATKRMKLDNYIRSISHMKFSWRHWNCCHFVTSFHGLEDKVNIENERGKLRDWPNKFITEIENYGFFPSHCEMAGDICMV